ncbi:DUF3592 domain-containing protein [Sphingomonas sp.]|uniref:DUF3592 domain-containing protein n=1 Tax=Sphingomonas sp. TaxID=28214 RepID=UPI001ED34665|nr:DUF3592 domain-containing protein [Sphingomonas sp.]MBX3594945.1 DUF3592 domain-containing protein [Sphingomonas sp.]
MDMQVLLWCWLAAFGAFALGFWTRSRIKRERAAASGSGNWQTVEGVIEESHLEAEDNSESWGTKVQPRVRYAYQVNGTAHTGTNPTRYPEFAIWEEAGKKWLDAHPVGARVPVHYDAADPAQSALVLNKSQASAGYMMGEWMMYAIGAFLLVIPFIV